MARVLKIGKKHYVVDFLWKPAKSRNLVKEAESECKDTSNNMYVIRTGVSRQIGVASSADGVRSGMTPLALVLSEQYPADLLVVLDVPQEWLLGEKYTGTGADNGGDDRLAWGLSMSEGYITEEVFGGREEVLDWFREEQKQIKPDHPTHTVASEEMTEIQADSRSEIEVILELAKKKRKPAVFRKVGEARTRMLIGVFVIACGVVVAMAVRHRLEIIAEQKHEQVLAAMRAMMAEKAREALLRPILYVAYKDMASACMKTWENMPKEFPGWESTEVICTPHQAGAIYRRDNAGLAERLHQEFSGFHIEMENKKADVYREIDQNVTVRKISPLNLANIDTKQRLEDFFRKHGFVPRWEQGGTKVLPGVTIAASNLVGVNKDIFRVRFPVFPDGWVYELDNIPGVVVRAIGTQITHQSGFQGDKGWVLRGVIYYVDDNFRKKIANMSPANQSVLGINHGKRTSAPPGKPVTSLGPVVRQLPGGVLPGLVPQRSAGSVATPASPFAGGTSSSGLRTIGPPGGLPPANIPASH